MTLENQRSRENEESINHRKMLFLQLVSTHGMFNNLDPATRLETDFILFDHDWSKHLIYVKNLDKKEFENVVDWFYAMHKLEVKANKNEQASIHTVTVLLENKLPEIAKVIEKLKLELK